MRRVVSDLNYKTKPSHAGSRSFEASRSAGPMLNLERRKITTATTPLPPPTPSLSLSRSPLPQCPQRVSREVQGAAGGNGRSALQQEVQARESFARREGDANCADEGDTTADPTVLLLPGQAATRRPARLRLRGFVGKRGVCLVSRATVGTFTAVCAE